MNKAMRIASVVLLVYLGMCVMVCMPLYTAFYPNAFSKLCFRIGEVLTLLTAINPMGLIAALVNGVCCSSLCRQGVTLPRRLRLWANSGVFLSLLGWLLVIVFFVHHSGGV